MRAGKMVSAVDAVKMLRLLSPDTIKIEKDQTGASSSQLKVHVSNIYVGREGFYESINID